MFYLINFLVVIYRFHIYKQSNIIFSVPGSVISMRDMPFREQRPCFMKLYSVEKDGGKEN